MPDARPKGSVPRRTVVKGAAWAVPAIAVAASVPAFAASQPLATTREDISGLAGKTSTQIYSSDGAHLVLTSGGQVWYWFGNNDGGALTARQLPNTGSVVELGVWANHPGNYFAGAFAIQASSCP